MSSVFTAGELGYLHERRRRLARVATADSRGVPHVTPVGMWRHDTETGTIDITGRRFATTKKFRNVRENPWATIVITTSPAPTRGIPAAIMIQGPAVTVIAADRPDDGQIRITPDTVISWGLEPPERDRHSRR